MIDVAVQPGLAVLVARDSDVARHVDAWLAGGAGESLIIPARPNRASKPRPKRRSFDTANPP